MSGDDKNTWFNLVLLNESDFCDLFVRISSHYKHECWPFRCQCLKVIQHAMDSTISKLRNIDIVTFLAEETREEDVND